MRLRYKSILVAFMLLQLAHVAHDFFWRARVADQVDRQTENVNAIRFHIRYAGSEVKAVCR